MASPDVCTLDYIRTHGEVLPVECDNLVMWTWRFLPVVRCLWQQERYVFYISLSFILSFLNVLSRCSFDAHLWLILMLSYLIVIPIYYCYYSEFVRHLLLNLMLDFEVF